MTIIDQEALEARARALYTIPPTIDSETYEDLRESCRTLLDEYYESDGERYLLNTRVEDIDPETRFKMLACLAPHNGMRMVLVSIVGNEAELAIHFYSRNFFDELSAHAPPDTRIFSISGGRRVLGGDAAGQIQVATPVSVEGVESSVLTLTVSPIGDYSTYTLIINTQGLPSGSIDPLFGEIDFKFRPGCFSIACAPEWEPGTPAKPAPSIDYLTKDYDSFKHTLLAAMSQRVPGWKPTSEADLDQVLLELFCAAGDELSDYQDRVMNEAYLGTARKRVSLARHARLMDYHIHQGNQATTWVALRLAQDAGWTFTETNPLTVWAGCENKDDPPAVVFRSRSEQRVHHLLNRLALYTWSGAVPALASGSTWADLQPFRQDGTRLTDPTTANDLQELIRSGEICHVLVQEWLNPLTGRGAGRDPRKRQLLELLPGDDGAEALEDPVTGESFVRVAWRPADALRVEYCFTVHCKEGDREYDQEDVSLFHGNLLPVYHGRHRHTVFKDPDDAGEDELHYELAGRWGTLCRLPEGPLAYRATPLGGEVPPVSTLLAPEARGASVNVVTGSPPSQTTDPWEEVISLVHSDDSAEHFMVEADEYGNSLLRFGDGENGQALPEHTEVHCDYQVGYGPDGNIGADQLRFYDSELIEDCWNPFDVTDGRAPEPAAEIIRRAPEAYRARQLRAVTLQDYVDRAEELPEVARAAAYYAWTGSWRTVRIAIDPVGGGELTPELRRDLASHLDAVRLIGEDLELRSPRFVPLEIRVLLCVHLDYWPEDVRFLLEQELSETYTRDGRMGFFHPDRWTFGQRLRASQIIGRMQRVEGVDHVVSVTMKRWNEPTPGTEEIADVRANEIIRVRNDPDHMEDGFLWLDPQGGRQ